MRKKRYLLSVVLVALIGGLACMVFRQSESAEPMYEGKPLTYWFRNYYLTAGHYWWQGKMYNAVRDTGTNAIPTLLRLLQAKDSPLKLRLSKAMESITLIHHQQYWTAGSRNMAGAKGFQILHDSGAGAVPDLLRILDLHVSSDSENCTIEALGHIGPGAEAAVKSLLQRVTGTNWFLSNSAMEALGKIHSHPELVVPVLIAKLRAGDKYAIEYSMPTAADALAGFGENARTAVPALLAILAQTNEFARLGAVRALGNIHASPELVLPALLSEINDVNDFTFWYATRAIVAYGTNAYPVVPELIKKLTATNESVRVAVCVALGELRAAPELAVPALIERLSERDGWVRKVAAEALIAFGRDASAAIDPLLNMLNNRAEDDENRRCAEIALRKIDPTALEQAVKDGRVKSP